MQSEFIGKPHAKQGQGAYILFWKIYLYTKSLYLPKVYNKMGPGSSSYISWYILISKKEYLSLTRTNGLQGCVVQAAGVVAGVQSTVH